MQKNEPTLKKRNFNFFSFLVSFFANFIVNVEENFTQEVYGMKKNSRCNRNHCDRTAT